MSQTFDAAKPQTAVTTFGELYQILRDHFAALRSAFSGTSFPSSPVQGQFCIRTDRGTYGAYYVYTGNVAVGESGWISLESILPELVTARGSTASLGARLGVALNADGTLKTTPPAGTWWTTEAAAVEYLASNQFRVAGDVTAIYLPRRIVTLDGDLARVVSATYSAGPDKTTVTVEGAAVPDPLSDVEYGQPPDSAPSAGARGFVTAATAFSTNSLTYVDLDSMTLTRTTTGRPGSALMVDFSVRTLRAGAVMDAVFAVVIDGSVVHEQAIGAPADTNAYCSIAYLALDLTAASHTIKIQVKTTTGLVACGYDRSLRVVEIA